jgi:hypothetical protein
LFIDLLSDYQQKSTKDTNTLIFGFVNMEPKEIEIGLLKLQDILLSQSISE